MTTCEKIKAARLANGMLQRECAELFGCCLQGWGHFERNGNRIKVCTLMKVAAVLDIDPEKLLPDVD